MIKHRCTKGNDLPDIGWAAFGALSVVLVIPLQDMQVHKKVDNLIRMVNTRAGSIQIRLQQYCVQVWLPPHKQDVNVLQNMLSELENYTYSGR